MPELPEVETVRRGLEPALVGRRIAHVEVRRPDLRFPFPDHFAERLSGRRIVALRRRAKYLLADLDSSETLIVHLGMTGRLTLAPAGNPGRILGDYAYAQGRDPRHDHVLVRLEDRTTVTYNDVRRFGFMLLSATAELPAHPLIASLGLEPLGGALDGASLAKAAHGRRAPLKAFLLDQRKIAGLGNIYVCEALFRAGLSPNRLAGRLATRSGGPTPAATRLAAEIRAVLEAAIQAGGSTLRDYKHADGSSGEYQNSFAVYGRDGEACTRPGCRGIVRRTTHAGRSTFACPACQR